MSQATLKRPVNVVAGVKPKRPPAAPALVAESVNLADLGKINLDLQRAHGVLWMLIRCVGGEIGSDERPEESDTVCCIQFVNRVLSRVDEDMGTYDERLHGDFATAISAGRGIASTLDAMTWADCMEIAGSDEVMSQLYDAIQSCVEDARAALAPLLFEGQVTPA
jgi:hypothetical protein